jgi:hypothetical protein
MPKGTHQGNSPSEAKKVQSASQYPAKPYGSNSIRQSRPISQAEYEQLTAPSATDISSKEKMHRDSLNSNFFRHCTTVQDGLEAAVPGLPEVVYEQWRNSIQALRNVLAEELGNGN